MSRHRSHGDADRFAAVARFVDEHCRNSITFIADVAGGQGMLTGFSANDSTTTPRWSIHLAGLCEESLSDRKSSVLN
jgi:hypothetical protein